MTGTPCPGQREAIEALLNSASVAEAARFLGMPAKKLSRLMDNPVFAAEYEAATRASFNHQMARQRQGAILAVKSAIRIMQEGKKPADRRKAVRLLIQLAKEDKEIREFGVKLRKLEHARRPSTGESAGTGPGAELSGKQKQAIAALLEQRTLAEAALATGGSVQTLCRWLNQPAFEAALAEAAREVWGQAMMLVRKCLPYALSQQRNFLTDPSIPDAVKLQVGGDLLNEGKADQMAALGDRLRNLETGAGEAEPGKTIERSLYRRVQRIKAGLRQAAGPVVISATFGHAVEGRAGGTSVRGPDGRLVWLNPPPGCEAGELVAEEAA